MPTRIPLAGRCHQGHQHVSAEFSQRRLSSPLPLDRRLAVVNQWLRPLDICCRPASHHDAQVSADETLRSFKHLVDASADAQTSVADLLDGVEPSRLNAPRRRCANRCIVSSTRCTWLKRGWPHVYWGDGHESVAISCPHCGSDSTIRTSRPLSDTVRRIKVTYSNPDCAHTWIAYIWPRYVPSRHR